MNDLRIAPRVEPDPQRLGLPPLSVLFGRTTAMAAVRRTIEVVAATQVPVLIQGESGTGKEVCARLLHQLSGKLGGSLIKVSCPAIPQGLLETELFGYEKGAFTGAHATKKGRVEQADRGTLLLDEVGSLDLGVQAKLLQLLQDGSFLRVGGHDMLTIRTRLISIANRDLQDQVQEGTLRLDLFYRINAMSIHVPPLRRRLEDLPELTDFFLEQHARAFNTRPVSLSRRVLDMMARYSWPGNIRQLDNLIRGYVLIGKEQAILDALVPEESTARDLLADVDLTQPLALKAITKRATQELERQIILKVLKANAWNRLKTARWLGISYRSLLYKLNEVGPQEVPGTRKALKIPASPTHTPGPPGLQTVAPPSR